MKKELYLSSMIAILASCSDDVDVFVDETKTGDTLTFSSVIVPFEGESLTRSSLDGSQFETGDRIRMKIITPFSNRWEYGELWSSYYLLELKEGGWTYNGNAITGATIGSYEAQKTPYVYTAIYSPIQRYFVSGNYRYSRPSNIFHADQSKLKNYKQSDLLWAQSFMQTGALNVALNFKHKVARLDITINDAISVSSNAVLTLEKMPDIDQAEIVVGDYYADESNEDYSFQYRTKASCSRENNGKVIGIEVLADKISTDDSSSPISRITCISGNPYPAGGAYNSGTYATVDNTGIYTAYHDPDHTNHFMLLVPPCKLTENAVFWLRDGEKRYQATLSQKEFVEGVSYKLKIVF